MSPDPRVIQNKKSEHKNNFVLLKMVSINVNLPSKFYVDLRKIIMFIFLAGFEKFLHFNTRMIHDLRND